MNTKTIVTIEMFNELQSKFDELSKKFEELNKKPDVKEMTKEHALSVLTGDLKDLKHKDAAEKLGLTYVQIYSCRLKFTFKDVHKEVEGQGFKNPWVK